MIRSVRLSMSYATDCKKVAIATFLQSYRHAVNFFIKSLWHNYGKLDSQTLNRLPLEKTRLSYKQREAALKQAATIVFSTRASAKALNVKPSLPFFNGAAILSKKLVLIQDGKKTFDFIVRITSLKKNCRIIIPTKKTKIFNYWISNPEAKIIQGCAISENKLIVWVDIPNIQKEFLDKENKKILGIDQGMNNLLVTSDRQFLGSEFKQLREKINRKQPKSQGKRRALEERRHFIGEQIKKLPWEDLKVLGIEELKGIKYGKGKLGKQFRKARIPWVHRMVTVRLEHKCQENRVLLVTVPPENTSRCCPACGKVSAKNRVGEKFLCVSCSHEDHADVVGAQNVLAKTILFLGSVASPSASNVEREYTKIFS